jgi:hypothetical protein
MNASGVRCRIIVGFVLCLVLAGCQALGAGGGKLVKEVELVCPIEDMHFGVEGFEMQFWQNMENGNISRASFGWSYLNCNEPTMKGWLYGLGDAYVHDDGITDTKNYTEIITDEGGVWKGMQECQYKEAGSYCHHTMTGEGLYEGLNATLEYYFDTSTARIRVTKE